MGGIEKFFFEKGDRKIFPLFKSKRMNLLAYVASVVIGVGMFFSSNYDERVYMEDLRRYEIGRISEKPVKSDYLFEFFKKSREVDWSSGVREK